MVAVTSERTRGSVASRRVPGPVVLVGGLVGGVVWGVNARIWMRYISTDPEFSWSGTIFIVAGFGIAGFAQACAFVARRRGLRRRSLTAVRVVTTVGLLPLGMGAGLPMLPTIVLASLAITHVDWRRWGRVVIGVAATVPLVLSAAPLFDQLPALRAVTGTAWFLAIYVGIVWAARFSLAPQLDGWRAPRAAWVVVVAATCVAVLLFAVLARGA